MIVLKTAAGALIGIWVFVLLVFATFVVASVIQELRARRLDGPAAANRGQAGSARPCVTRAPTAVTRLASVPVPDETTKGEAWRSTSASARSTVT